MAAISIKHNHQDIDLQTGVGPYMCENARAPFLSVSSSHVDAISSDSSRRIRALAILRGERNEFLRTLLTVVAEGLGAVSRARMCVAYEGRSEA